LDFTPQEGGSSSPSFGRKAPFLHKSTPSLGD